MTDLKTRFSAAQAAVKALPEKPDNDTLLDLYAWYKQGTQGDCSGERPGFFDFVGQAKHDAWEKLAGSSPEDAQQAYIDRVEKLTGKSL